jgi:hypothetical protein
MRLRPLLFAALSVLSLPSFAHDLKLDTERLLRRLEGCEQPNYKWKSAVQFVSDHKKRVITNYPFSLGLTFSNILFIDSEMTSSCRRGMLENMIEVMEYLHQTFPDSFSAEVDLRDLAQAKFMYTAQFNPQYGYQYEDADQDLRQSIAAADDNVTLHSYAYVFLAKAHPPIAPAAYRRATEVALHAYKRKPNANLLIPFKMAQEKLIAQATDSQKQALQKQLIDVMEADTEGFFHIDLAEHYSSRENDTEAGRHLDRYFVKERKKFVDSYQFAIQKGRDAELAPTVEYCADSMRYFFVRRKLSPALKGRYDPEALAKSVCAPP